MILITNCFPGFHKYYPHFDAIHCYHEHQCTTCRYRYHTDGDKTLTEQKTEREEREKFEVSKHPRIQAVLENFPESEVIAVRNVSAKDGPIIEEGK